MDVDAKVNMDLHNGSYLMLTMFVFFRTNHIIFDKISYNDIMWMQKWIWMHGLYEVYFHKKT